MKRRDKQNGTSRARREGRLRGRERENWVEDRERGDRLLSGGEWGSVERAVNI